MHCTCLKKNSSSNLLVNFAAPRSYEAEKIVLLTQGAALGHHESAIFHEPAMFHGLEIWAKGLQMTKALSQWLDIPYIASVPFSPVDKQV